MVFRSLVRESTGMAGWLRKVPPLYPDPVSEPTRLWHSTRVGEILVSHPTIKHATAAIQVLHRRFYRPWLVFNTSTVTRLALRIDGRSLRQPERA